MTSITINKRRYRLPPRADNKTTTRGPAETTKTRLTRVRANSRFIINKKIKKKNQKVTVLTNNIDVVFGTFF